MDSREWLEQTFEEVSPLAFYRDLFPLGELDKKGAFSKGKYCGICVQVKDQKAKRYTITDELDNLEELLSTDDFTVISPLSYAGKSQKATNQRFCYAIAVDLDNLIVSETGEPVGIESLLSQTKDVPFGKQIVATNPRPTYIVASSANNVHLYYLLDKPIPMYKSNKESLARYKTNLTERLWNIYITKDYKATQQEPIGQGMRAVGSISKDGKSRVRAFRTGDRVTIDYLNRYPFCREENKIKVWNSPEPRDKKIVAGRKATTVKPAFYEWYKRQLPDYAVEGKRYFGLMVMAIIGRKCGISREQVEDDALSFVPQLDEKTRTADNHFTNEDALKAITAFDVDRFMFMKRETLVRLSGVPMKANKRNGRKQDVHMKYLNGTNAVKRALGEEFATGRPNKQNEVLFYFSMHPDMSNRQIAEALGISRNTVNKWLKECRMKLDT